ncbi:type II secretion system F family protein [Halobium salinum]|uniref:Type II secretion system F family protein n=1 Tax=Halobium salinum TaxID=1364940 RepID=A0ABD5P7H3_9EURY|nr:type II secretion system F family protein [Halobium salinum]
MLGLHLLPLLVAFGLCLSVVLDRLDRRVALGLTRLALVLFGDYVGQDTARRTRQLQRMRGAHVAATHRTYAARTLLFSGVYGVAGAVIGVYAAGWLVSTLGAEAALAGALPAALSFVTNLGNLSAAGFGGLFLLLLLSSATIGAGLAAATYWGRWVALDSHAATRARAIDVTLPRSVAFVYALSRSGMPFPAVMRTLAANREVYGEAATEFGVAVRDVETFNTDVLTAVQHVARSTPSDGLREFSDNLASVLGSGQSVSTFLRDQYERFQSRAEAQQAQYVELLATFAEVYVTVLVAGPLFLVTILAVIGLVLADTLPLVRAVVYVGLPLATVAFALYVDAMTTSLQGPAGGGEAGAVDETGAVGGGRDGSTLSAPAAADDDEVGVAAAVADGGVTAGADRWAENRRRLGLHRRLAPLRGAVADPLGTVLGRPTTTLALTVPVALLWVALTADFPAEVASAGVDAVALSALDVTAALGAVDDALIQGAALVLLVFTVVHELRRRRQRAIEAAMPDLLDRLASVNEAGMTVVASVERVAKKDSGALAPELERTWRDIRWGADVSTALRRLDRRVGSTTVTRAVTLVTNAMRASGDVGPVLRIAADEAQTSQRLKQERRQEMLTYLMVIYVSFFVFLAIVTALLVAFIPAIDAAQAAQAAQSAAAGGSGATTAGGGLGALGSVDTAAYAQAFYHASVVQALCSGIVAGQLGGGRVADGAKHALVMLLAAYATNLAVPTLTTLWQATVVAG